jgi:hypothetical protein
VIAILIVVYASTGDADNGLITQCQVGDIRIGDSLNKITKQLKSNISIKTINKPGHIKEVILSQGPSTLMRLSVDSKDNVLLINVYAAYSTSKNIYPGSTLSEVLAAYGEGKINPTDEGYFVYFDDVPGMQFLIDKNDVPKILRGIPDDVITERQEKQILSLGKARIKLIQIFCINKNS